MKKIENKKNDNNQELLLLEEIFNKVKNNEEISSEEFYKCIAAFNLEIREQVDEVLCRLTEHRILRVPRVNDDYYSLKLKQYQDTNNRVNLVKEVIYNVRNMMLKSIDMVLDDPSAKNIEFLFEQKALFDEYYEELSGNLENYFVDKLTVTYGNIESGFYLVKDRMLENQENMKN